MSTQRKSKTTHFKTSFYFQVLLIYMELILHIIADHSGIFSLICDILLAIPLGMLLGAVTTYSEKRINLLLTQGITVVLAVLFLIRIFRNIKFGGFLPILGIIVSIVLLILPCLFILQKGRKYLSFRQCKKEKLQNILVTALIMLVVVGIFSFAGNQIGKSKSDQNKQAKKNSSVQDSTSSKKRTGPNVMDIDFDSILTNTSGNDDANSISQIVTALKDAESTNKNEYTGMFEGYNVVFVTAENLSKYAISQDLTPTLYSMMNDGFVFKNYYSQNFISNATGNEYALTGSMIPGSSVKEALGEMNELDRNMYLSLEDQLERLDYKINTYSDLQYDDFVFDSSAAGTDDTDTSGTDTGSDDTDTAGTDTGTDDTNTTGTTGTDDTASPNAGGSSSGSMVSQTTADYTGNSSFYTSYKVNTGLSSYDYDEDNIYAAKLNDLEYTDETKAYLAYQMALDQQMKELIDALQSAGVADKTLIVVAPNPSKTSTQAILGEISGQDMTSTLSLRSNALIIYSTSMQSPITVDKYCSSLDVLPTVSNLLGLDYDSRLMMGKDILSDASQFVLFPESSGFSFITDSFIYDAVSGESISLAGGSELDDATIESTTTAIETMKEISDLVFSTNFYQYIDPDIDFSAIENGTAGTDDTDTDGTDDSDTGTNGTGTDGTDAAGTGTDGTDAAGTGTDNAGTTGADTDA